MNLKKRITFATLSIISLILLATILICLLEIALYFRAPHRFFKRPTIKTRSRELFTHEIGTCFMNDEYLPYKLKPNCTNTLVRDNKLTINSLGYRGNEFTLKKDPDTFRILLVGDSFVYGFALDDKNTIPSLLEDKLQKKFKNIEVINAGFHGYTPAQYDLYLRNEGYKLNPDMIILMVLADNDMLDITYNIFSKFDIDGLPTKIIDSELAYKGFRYSRIMPAWMYRIPPIMNSRACFWLLHKVNMSLRKFKKRYNFNNSNLEHFFERPMLGIINDSRKRNIIIKPWLIIGGGIIREEDGANNQYYKSMRMFFERNNFEYLDLGSELLKYPHTDVCYQRLNGFYDGHLNEKGNNIVSELGAESLIPLLRKINQ